MKRIAPQENPSVVVVFVTKAPCSHPIFLHAFPIHNLIVSVNGVMKNGSYIREREKARGRELYVFAKGHDACGRKDKGVIIKKFAN